MTTARITEPETTSAAQRAIDAAETAAKEAAYATRQFAETLPFGYANGIVPHRATLLANQAADMASHSATIMRRAVEVAEAESEKQQNA